MLPEQSTDSPGGLQKLLALWPGLAHILACAESPMDELRIELAACCLLAMRHHSGAFAPLLGPFCQLSAASFQSPATAKFAQALALAVSVYSGQGPPAQQPLRQALDAINAAPAVQSLQELGRADLAPDFAMVSAHGLGHDDLNVDCACPSGQADLAVYQGRTQQWLLNLAELWH